MTVLPIPRDLEVGGPACTVRAVQQLTGLRIDRVIGIDFAGFKAMVDAVGGVQVNICQPIIDTELGTVIPTVGQQVITGDTALNLVRARQVHGDPTGDLGRIRRQQIVLSALLREVTSAGTLLSPAKQRGPVLSASPLITDLAAPRSTPTRACSVTGVATVRPGRGCKW